MLKNKYIRFKKQVTTQGLLLVSLCFALVAWVIFVATPFDIIASNSEEFIATPRGTILWNALVYFLSALISLVLLYLLFGFVTNMRFQKVWMSFIAAFSASVWLNATFLIGEYGRFDGPEGLQVDLFSTISWIQIGSFSIIFALALYFRDRTKIFIQTVASVLVISFITAGLNLLSHWPDTNIKQVTSEDSFFTYSKNKPNVLFILLDEYQTNFFKRIHDDEIEQILSGFTWFPENMSLYPRTFASMPTTLAQEIYTSKGDIYTIYKSIQKEERSVPFVLANNGFHVAYTGPVVNYLRYLFPENTYAYHFKSHFATYKSLVQYALFRSAPDVFKRNVYNQGRWLRRVTLFNIIFPSLFFRGSQFHDRGESYDVLNQFRDGEISVKNSDHGYYKYYHSLLTHGPIGLKKDCSVTSDATGRTEARIDVGICVLKSLDLFFNKLKHFGVYDNTMIVIAADHGHGKLPAQKASAFLAIKGFNETGKLKIDYFHSTNLDIPYTILEALDINHPFKAVNILSQNKPNIRTRQFYDYEWTREFHAWNAGVPPLTKYTINGSVSDPKSWRKHITRLGCRKSLDFSGRHHTGYFNSDLVRSKKKSRWSQGAHAEIEFKMAPDCKAQSVSFNLRAFVMSQNPQRAASVFINDKPVGEVRISAGDVQPKRFLFALPEAQDNNYTIRFVIDKTTNPKSSRVNNDIREQGFGFISMELLDDEAAAR